MLSLVFHTRLIDLAMLHKRLFVLQQSSFVSKSTTKMTFTIFFFLHPMSTKIIILISTIIIEIIFPYLLVTFLSVNLQNYTAHLAVKGEQ